MTSLKSGAQCILLCGGDINMKIEKPWEECFCDKCIHCFEEDMCGVYMLGMSYAYCPQLRQCEKFKEKALLEINTKES